MEAKVVWPAPAPCLLSRQLEDTKATCSNVKTSRNRHTHKYTHRYIHAQMHTHTHRHTQCQESLRNEDTKATCSAQILIRHILIETHIHAHSQIYTCIYACASAHTRTHCLKTACGYKSHLLRCLDWHNLMEPHIHALHIYRHIYSGVRTRVFHMWHLGRAYPKKGPKKTSRGGPFWHLKFGQNDLTVAAVEMKDICLPECCPC